ncbi:EF-P 5-aminopentanol modification-associated protein YfmF [Salipaludibacillus daqingensis]|uniref:EF-P 5-aminopentanol modification-associated protein YfmF n=1 Tax=Salipaludibacillus daqingensis TaxID=3041001 RepID=UPI0024757506|nr:pitrilysin family protein [Salipaludibacillus daqingensis]
MEQEELKQFDIGSIRVHVIPSTTFKTNTMMIQMNGPLEKDSVTKRALLPNILQNGTKDYPSRQHIRSALEELYGASLTADVAKKGERQILSLRMDLANEKFLKDHSPLLEKGIKLLASVFLNPNVTNDQFDSKIIDEEKRSQRQKISSIYDDKMRFANKRLTEEMCPDEPFGIHVLGYEEDLDAIDGKNLYDYYQDALNSDDIDFYVMGDVDSEHIKTMIKKHFKIDQSHRREEKPKNTPDNNKKKANEVVDEQSVQQAKLHIGYRTNIVYGDDDYFALQIFNGIFGGFSHSKLFINVREKASLAYYAASRVESHKGLLIVMSGIQSSKYNDATEIIFKQMEDMQNGEFTEVDIQQTKAVYKNQVLETMDVPRGRIEMEYHNQIASKKIPLNEWLERIDQVTHDDILNVAKKIQLDTIYFLKGKEEESNE